MAAPKRSKDQIRKDRAEIMRRYLRGKTLREIATEFNLHYTQIKYDLDAIRKEWRESAIVDFNEKKMQELSRIDEAERAAWEGWENSLKDTVRTRTGKDSFVATISNAGNPKFLDVVIKCIERRCKLLGIDAPIQAEISGKDGEPIAMQYIAVPDECADYEEWLNRYGNERSISNN